MIITICFVVSATLSLLAIVTTFNKEAPLPILHVLGVDASNTYVYTPSFMFQVWFWANHFNLFV